MGVRDFTLCPCFSLHVIPSTWGNDEKPGACREKTQYDSEGLLKTSCFNVVGIKLVLISDYYNFFKTMTEMFALGE